MMDLPYELIIFVRPSFPPLSSADDLYDEDSDRDPLLDVQCLSCCYASYCRCGK